MPAIGIDLGTAYSSVSIFENEPKIIINDNGSNVIPSTVCFEKNGYIVGIDSKNNNTIYNIKRLIGRNYDDPLLQSFLKHINYSVENDNGKPVININENIFTPEHISSLILKKLKDIAEKYCQEEIKDVVITVPAYFNDLQKKATINAASMANLNILRIINEPTAAALLYDENDENDTKILIFDIGAGTLDVSILNKSTDGIYDIIATYGDCDLGGEDIDNTLVIECIKYFIKINNFKNPELIFKNTNILRKLKIQCKKAKEILSTSMTTNIIVDSMYDNIDFNMNITRSKFDYICSNIWNRCKKPIDCILNENNIDKDEIDKIILIGGSSKIPKIKNLLNEFFNIPILNHIDPDIAVSMGACKLANMLINKHSTDIVLFDIIPHSLGIELNGGIYSKIIKKNTKIPCKKRKIFTTNIDNQSLISIKIFQGENNLTKYNQFLGDFDLCDIVPLKKGLPKIAVEFIIDVNGILKVKAIDETGDKCNEIVIKTNSEYNFKKIFIHQDNEYVDNILNIRQKHEKYINYLDNIYDNEIVYNYLIKYKSWFSNIDGYTLDEYNDKLNDVEKFIKNIKL